MRPAEAVALGLLQGPAELLPDLLVRARRAAARRRDAGRRAARKEIEVALHLGTAVALALSERPAPRSGLLAAATAPPALAGLRARAARSRSGWARRRRSPPVCWPARLAMVVADRTPARRGAARPGSADGAWLGLAQALGADPGRVAQRRHARRRPRARLRPRGRGGAVARGRAAGAGRRGRAQGLPARPPPPAGERAAHARRRRRRRRRLDVRPRCAPSAR